MARFDAVLFDVDGTLIHSQPGIFHSFSYAFRKLGIDPDTVELSRYLGPPLRWSFAQHFSDEATVEEAVRLYRENYAVDGSFRCEVYPGAERLLAELKNAGVLLCTATSKPVEVVTPILKAKGLYEYFDAVGGASMDASVDTKTAVMKQLLESPLLRGRSCVMVGDRKDDMEGARDCGVPAVGVLYGYGSRDELAPWKPLQLVNSCDELLRYLLPAK